MEEKQEKKQEPELKGKMPIVWLTGILVIILGCVTVYTFKLVNENKKSKQVPQAQQPQVIEQEQKTEETAKTETITENASKKLSEKEALEIGNELFKKMSNILDDKDLLKDFRDGYKDSTIYVLTDSQIKKIYSHMTNNAQKQFEKLTNYFVDGKNKFYDLGELDVNSIFATTDVGDVKLKVNTINENEIIFDIEQYVLEGNELDYVHEKGFIIKKINSNWIIDSIIGNKIKK